MQFLSGMPLAFAPEFISSTSRAEQVPRIDGSALRFFGSDPSVSAPNGSLTPDESPGGNSPCRPGGGANSLEPVSLRPARKSLTSRGRHFPSVTTRRGKRSWPLRSPGCSCWWFPRAEGVLEGRLSPRLGQSRFSSVLSARSTLHSSSCDRGPGLERLPGEGRALLCLAEHFPLPGAQVSPGFGGEDFGRGISCNVVISARECWVIPGGTHSPLA